MIYISGENQYKKFNVKPNLTPLISIRNCQVMLIYPFITRHFKVQTTENIRNLMKANLRFLHSQQKNSVTNDQGNSNK